MKKYYVLVFTLSLIFLSGCSSIEDKELEARDKSLIAKTKQLEARVKLYHLEFSKYPVVLDNSQNPKIVKIYYGSQDWQELEEEMQLASSLKGVKAEISERITENNPIEYFSDGISYTFNVNLNKNTKYTLLETDYQCQPNEQNICVLTISSQ